jgi:hypothetical protein
VPHHLEPVEPPDSVDWDDDDSFDFADGGGDFEPIVRPAWWRWVAIAVIVALVVAGPFAYAIFKLLN